MAKQINAILRKDYHSGAVKKSITINVSRVKAWKKLSNIINLPEWLVDVKKTRFASKKRRGIGAIREIEFDDGNMIEEHVVLWEEEKSFTYIATQGLPLRAYVATISIKPLGQNTVQVTWQSYLNSKKMPEPEFTEFVKYLGAFYKDSLKNLKRILEVDVNTISCNN